MSKNQKQFIFCLLCLCTMFCFVALAQYTALPLVTQAAREQVEDAENTTISFAEYNKIDLNTAKQEQLCLLSGVGEQKANYIIEYRVLVGAFASVEEVANVTGITLAMVEAWGDMVYVSPIK